MKMIKKMYSLSPYIFISLIAISTLFWELGINGDELWNYNFMKNISDGLVPYRDFNMVQTPFAAYFGAIWMMVFGKDFIIYKLLGVVFMILTFSLFYYIIKQSSKSRELAFAVTVFYILLIYNTWIYNYNTLNLFVLVLFFYIKLYKKDCLKNGILIAILVGMMPLIKQTTGACVFFSYVMINLFDKNKSKFRFCIESAVALIPSGLYLLYLLGSGTLLDFVDYAVVGVKYFTHKITYIDFMLSSIVYFAIGIGFVVICSLTMKNILSIDDKNRKIEIIRFVIISFAAGVVAYPLTDRSHILLAVMPYMICWFLSMKDIHITRKEGISIYLFSAMLIVLAMPVIVNIDDSHKWSSLNRFEHILVDEDMEQNIVRVCDFIKENNQKGIDVYITNESACVYMIPLEIYNKNYDMLLLGNLGSNTVEDLLDVDDSSLFLVYKNKEIINWQCHFELIDYITENYECVGEINNYDIYRKNAE